MSDTEGNNMLKSKAFWATLAAMLVIFVGLIISVNSLNDIFNPNSTTPESTASPPPLHQRNKLSNYRIRSR